MGQEEVRRLYWRNIAPRASLHAAHFALERSSGYQITLHDHDFCELMLVLEGEAEHPINGQTGRLVAGSLLFLRPSDRHAVQVSQGQRLHWINVAFPLDAWEDSRKAAGLPDSWGSGSLPPSVLVPPTRLAACAAPFLQALHGYRRSLDRSLECSPDRLTLFQFLAGTLPVLLERNEDPPPASPGPEAPAWLQRACASLQSDPEALAEGAPRLQALAEVSAGHLARTLKAATGQTPTQWVNHLRLSRAALLLTTTSLPIIQVAGDCGFANLSYFYRRFQERYGQSPHAFRRTARHPVAPVLGEASG